MGTYILVNDVEESATICRVEEIAIGSEGLRARATLSAIASCV